MSDKKPIFFDETPGDAKHMPPPHVRRKSLREMLGLKPGEPVGEALLKAEGASDEEIEEYRRSIRATEETKRG
jgi:hypothetical protein